MNLNNSQLNNKSNLEIQNLSVNVKTNNINKNKSI